MSLFAARIPLRQVALRRATAVPSRSMHAGEYKHLPFETKNRTAFGLKFVSYLLTGFSIPFIAAYYQLRKSSGGS
ncbi:unnamed protein product [Somion occarium]|uniref:Cytochrome c oxidase subunit 8, mitochondrial n=1 Tax=Somion occarium TaxID=3059160 RepID=A0ABP1D6R3_9APHY